MLSFLGCECGLDARSPGVQGGCGQSGALGVQRVLKQSGGHRPEPRQLSLTLTDLLLTNPSFPKGCHS